MFRILAQEYGWGPDIVKKLTMTQLLAYVGADKLGPAKVRGSIQPESDDKGMNNENMIAAAKRLKDQTGKTSFNFRDVYSEMNNG